MKYLRNGFALVPPFLPLLAPLGLLTACSTTLSTMTPAEPTPQGHVRAVAAAGVRAPVGTTNALLKEAHDLTQKSTTQQPLTDAERTALVDKSIAALFDLPGVSQEIQLRYGLLAHGDVGLRLATGAVRVDLRHALYSSDESGFAVSVGVGGSYGSWQLKIADELGDTFQSVDHKQYEIDVPLLAGWSGRLGHLWAGPKVIYTRHVTELTFASSAGAPGLAASARGAGWLYGGQLGFAVGYRWVWIAGEITVMQHAGTAEVSSDGAQRTVGYGGLVLQPTLGLILQI